MAVLSREFLIHWITSYVRACWNTGDGKPSLMRELEIRSFPLRRFLLESLAVQRPARCVSFSSLPIRGATQA
jgi:hypothetical protein